MSEGFDRNGVPSYAFPEAVAAIEVLGEHPLGGTVYEATCGACGRVTRFTTTTHPGSDLDDADWHWDGGRWVCYKDGPYASGQVPAVFERVKTTG